MTEEEAVRRAAHQVGLRDLNDIEIKASVARLSHQSLPFLWRQLGGRDTWRVEFRGVQLDKAAGIPRLANRYVRRLLVWMAPDSGQVMKVTSVWPEGVCRIAPFPPCAEEQRQMEACATRYTGLPQEAPAITLLQALALEGTLPWSSEVKQIHACYVLETSTQYRDKPVWIIHLRGFPPMRWSQPMKSRIPQPPEDASNHMRNVVDARLGDWLGAGTMPQPLTTPLEYRQ